RSAVALRVRELGEERPQRVERHLPDLGHVASSEQHGESLLAEPAPAARVARPHGDEAAELVADPTVVVQPVVLVDVIADGLAAGEHPLEARDDPLVDDLLSAAMRLL